MAPAKISKKHQIVIPKEIRHKMDLHAGTMVSLYPLDKRRAILVKQPIQRVEALKGLGKEVWQSLGGTAKYIKQERLSWNKKSA